MRLLFTALLTYGLHMIGPAEHGNKPAARIW
jgi:hypothetical protein